MRYEGDDSTRTRALERPHGALGTRPVDECLRYRTGASGDSEAPQTA